LWEWPRSVAWMERLAGAVVDAVNTGESRRSPRTLLGVGLARTAVFLTAVLVHVLRRSLPPY
jgi:hypothetical protein